jgi:uncharacterized integral membrane protein
MVSLASAWPRTQQVQYQQPPPNFAPSPGFQIQEGATQRYIEEEIITDPEPIQQQQQQQQQQQLEQQIIDQQSQINMQRKYDVEWKQWHEEQLLQMQEQQTSTLVQFHQSAQQRGANLQYAVEDQARRLKCSLMCGGWIVGVLVVGLIIAIFVVLIIGQNKTSQQLVALNKTVAAANLSNLNVDDVMNFTNLLQ